MRTAAGHIFTAAVLGTLVLPLVLALLGLRAPHGRRTRLVLVAAATAAAAARRSVPAASGVALVALVWLVDLVMLADLATLSLGH